MKLKRKKLADKLGAIHHFIERAHMEDYSSEYRISAEELSEAEKLVRLAEKKAKQNDADLRPESLAKAQGELVDADYELQNELKAVGPRKIRFQILQMLASTSQFEVAWVVILLGTIVLFLLCFVIVRSVSAALLVAFILAALASATLVISKAVLDPSTDDVKLAFDHWQNCLRMIHRLEERVRVLKCQENYKNALDDWTRLRQIAESERYKLLQVGWRALRAIPFEDYIANVFELLGYEVEKTKASGDQGIDLIAVGKGRRIGIQCKGYESSVGNSAVQEAYTGKQFYDCNSCMVITNSVFTRAAIELAAKVNCQLIDENSITHLIMGKIL